MWSKINKQHVAELIEAELMTDAGLSAVEVVKQNGAWSLLDPVDALIVPADLGSALGGSERAREAYEALSASAKRAVLYSLYSAKREDAGEAGGRRTRRARGRRVARVRRRPVNRGSGASDLRGSSSKRPPHRHDSDRPCRHQHQSGRECLLAACRTDFLKAE